MRSGKQKRVWWLLLAQTAKSPNPKTIHNPCCGVPVALDPCSHLRPQASMASSTIFNKLSPVTQNVSTLALRPPKPLERRGSSDPAAESRQYSLPASLPKGTQVYTARAPEYRHGSPLTAQVHRPRCVPRSYVGRPCNARWQNSQSLLKLGG